MRVQAAGVTRRGARDTNQDAMGLFGEEHVFAVADGMGGLEHGERVSAAVIDLVRQRAPSLAARANALHGPNPAEARSQLFAEIEGLFTKAAADIYRMSEEQGARMGTTLTLVLLAGSRVIIGHIGDTRVYRVRGAEVEQLTEDHSVAAARLRRKQMSEAEYANSPQKSVLYQSLGPTAEVEADVVEASLQAGDLLVLCSDGVWGSLSDEQIAVLSGGDDPRAAARSLAETAMSQGSEDNCTALVLRIVDPGVGTDAPLPRSLAASTLFREFQESELRLLAPYISHRDLAEGEYVFREGDPGEEMFIIERGAVELSRQGFPLAQLGPGVHMGELAMAGGASYTTSAKAVVPTRLLVLHRRYIDALTARRPDLAARVLRALLSDVANRLVDFNDRMGRAERALWTQR